MSRRVLLVQHITRPRAQMAAQVVLETLQNAGVEVIDAGPDVPEPQLSAEDMTGVDLAIVLGGDGTILRAVELTRGLDIPILGVNLGHVGFLAEVESEELVDTVNRAIAGDFTIEQRVTLEVLVTDPDGTEHRGWALNEATLEKSERARMVELVVGIDGRPLSSFGADGIVIATPTGSTAHAFSGGGPVVWPEVSAMLVVPLAAHALFARPMVLGPTSVLTVGLLERSISSGIISLDGRRQLLVPQGGVLSVCLSDTPVRLARLSDAPFTDRLVSKFALPVTGWRDRLEEQ